MLKEHYCCQCDVICWCLDRGNDNWLIKYDMPDIDETHQDVSWSLFFSCFFSTLSLWFPYCSTMVTVSANIASVLIIGRSPATSWWLIQAKRIDASVLCL